MAINNSRAAAAGILSVAATVALTGTAYAVWSSTGSGSHSDTGSTVSITLTPVAVSTGLYPGSSSAVSVTVTNTSASHPLTVTALTAGPTTISAAGKGSCVATTVSFVAGTLPETPLAPDASVSVPGTVSMAANAVDGCQGTSFSIPLTVTGRFG